MPRVTDSNRTPDQLLAVMPLVVNLVRAGLVGDKARVEKHAVFLADKLDELGREKSAHYIRRTISGKGRGIVASSQEFIDLLNDPEVQNSVSIPCRGEQDRPSGPRLVGG